MKFEEALKLLKDGKKIRRLREESDFNEVIIWFDKYHRLVQGDGTRSDFDYSLELEDVFAINWEEYKELLLTEDEKEFLKLVIKMLPYRLDSLVLNRDYSVNENCLVFVGNTEEHNFGSIYVSGYYFRNLEIGKVYSIKELKLDEA